MPVPAGRAAHGVARQLRGSIGPPESRRRALGAETAHALGPHIGGASAAHRKFSMYAAISPTSRGACPMGACTKRRAVAQSTRCGPLAVGVGRSLGHALTRPIACAVDRDHLSQCGPYMVGTDGGFVARSHDPTAGFVAKMHTRSDHHESMPVLVRIGASSTTPRDPPQRFCAWQGTRLRGPSPRQ